MPRDYRVFLDDILEANTTGRDAGRYRRELGLKGRSE